MEEIDILYGIHDALAGGMMDSFSLAIDFLFRAEIIWGAVALILLLHSRTRTFGAVMLFALFLDVCIVYGLKLGVHRVRPVNEYDIDTLITSYRTSSFPSGHTAQWFCAATVVAVFCRPAAPFMFTFATIVAITRMYLFAHYPTDVIAGAVIGIVCALVSIFILLRMYPRTVFVKNPQPLDEGSE